MFPPHETTNVNSSFSTELNHSTVRNTTYAYLYDALKKYFLQWYLPVVICLGFFGSAFCLIFLTRSHIFPKNLRIWLISICVGDFLILAMEGVWMMLKVWYGFDIRDVNDTLCILHISFSNYLFYWSAYVQCFVSMQRCYLVLKPFRVNSRFLSAKNLLLCLLLVSVLLIFPILPYSVYWRVIDGDCDPVNEEIFRLTTIFDLVFWGIIPLVLMTTSTVIIWRNLLQRQNQFDSIGNFRGGNRLNSVDLNTYRNRNIFYQSPKRHSVAICRLQINSDSVNGPKRVPKFSFATSTVSPISTISGTVLHQSVGSSRGSDAVRRKPASDGNAHVTLVLICMNFVYMASVYPLIIYFICLNFVFNSLDEDVHRFIYYLFRSFCFMNACTNWIFYCVAGSTFRKRTRHLVQLVCCRRASGGPLPRSVETPIPVQSSIHWRNSTNRYKYSVYEQVGPVFRVKHLSTTTPPLNLALLGTEASNQNSIT
ncbi:Rhodopsin orphan GPCR [Fasciolopsis buskii]|uniref:Rhodopsin orphan GPCR n=1 Tax=Fasciolopsis buskii TaxID=27845 RepID=A0A8E0RP16_9TREM|nr:Rhodopsin orphan GPCR [Fasciolopsis buski]